LNYFLRQTSNRSIQRSARNAGMNLYESTPHFVATSHGRDGFGDSLSN